MSSLHVHVHVVLVVTVTHLQYVSTFLIGSIVEISSYIVYEHVFVSSLEI